MYIAPACHSVADNGEPLTVWQAVRALLYCGGSFYCALYCVRCLCVVIVATYGIGSRIESVQFPLFSRSVFRPVSIYFRPRLRR